MVQRDRRLSEVDEGLRPLLVQKRTQVVARADPANVFDIRLRGQRRSEDRADLAAVTGDRDLDRPAHLPTAASAAVATSTVATAEATLSWGRRWGRQGRRHGLLADLLSDRPPFPGHSAHPPP